MLSMQVILLHLTDVESHKGTSLKRNVANAKGRLALRLSYHAWLGGKGRLHQNSLTNVAMQKYHNACVVSDHTLTCILSKISQ